MHRAAQLVSGGGDDHWNVTPPVVGGRRVSATTTREQPMVRLRILIADDHEIVRLGVRALVETHPGWLVCAEATDGPDAIEKAKKMTPDVAIMNLTMPGLDGIEATRQIRQAAPKTEILILTADSSEQRAREAIAAGARGYLLKSDAGRDLTNAIKSVAQHKPFFTSRIAELAPNEGLQPSPSRKRPSQAGTLTRREREVVQLLAEGKTAKEVAGLLGISRKTVETHRANVARKLQLRSLGELIRYAIRNGLTKA